MNDQQVRAYFDRLSDAIEVGPAPVDAVLEERNGHRVRIVVGVAVAGLVAAAVIAIALANRGDGSPRPVDPATVTDSVGPIESQPGDGAWWTPGTIHFDTGDVSFDDAIGSMVPAADGVIVATLNGSIVLVETSGQATEIGSFPPDKTAGPTFQVDRVDGDIAWTDGDRLFVFDPAEQTVVAERPSSGSFRPASAFLLGFDQGRVYWDNSLGNRVWDWTTDTTQRIGNGSSYVHGVRNGTWLVEAGRGYGVLADGAEGGRPSRLPPDLIYPMPGFSPDGTLVALTSLETDRIVVLRSVDPSGPGTELALPAGRLAAITWRDDGSLFVVLLQPDSETRALATCSAATGACTAQQEVDDRVVIAGDSVQELTPQ